MTVTPGGGEPEEQNRTDEQPRDDEQPRADALSGPDEQTQVGPPPAFPSVGGAPGPSAASQTDAQPLFTSQGVEPERPQPDGTYVTSVAPVRSQDAGGPGGRWRWIVAAVATVAVVALVAGIFFFAPRAGAPSVVSLYAPADSVAYVELRLDLPGDQRDRLVSFMSRFPGFADPATFEQKIKDTLQQALRASNSGLDWNADVAPWFGGQIGMFTGTLTPSSGTPPSITAALTVKDRTRLDELVNARVAQTGAQQEDYKGQTVWTVSSGEHRLSLAVTDEALLVSTRIEDLKAALDVKAGQVAGLATEQFFSQQMSALHDDRLAAFYVDYEALNDASLGDLPQTGFFGDACIDNLTSASSLKLVAEIRAEADHLAVTSRMSAPSVAGAPPLPANRQTALAEAVPNSTVAYLELRDVGAGIKFVAEQALACFDTSTTPFDTRALEQFLGVPPQNFFDFVQDVAIAVTYEGGQPGGGLIATVDDEIVARLRMERLLSTVRGLAALGGGLVVEEQQHGDATITILRAEGLPEGTPVDSVALTVSGGRLYLGVGDFVTGALDRAAADSLAGSERFRAALAAAGAENAGLIYVDMTAIRGALEGLMPQPDRAQYDTDVKPFVEPFSHVLFVNRTADGMVVGTYFVYVE